MRVSALCFGAALHSCELAAAAAGVLDDISSVPGLAAACAWAHALQTCLLCKSCSRSSSLSRSKPLSPCCRPLPRSVCCVRWSRCCLLLFPIWLRCHGGRGQWAPGFRAVPSSPLNAPFATGYAKADAWGVGQQEGPQDRQNGRRQKWFGTLTTFHLTLQPLYAL